jgi:uncharacterized membrane protein YeiH
VLTVPHWIDLSGVFFFAMSGALAAYDKSIYRDFFGITFIAFITAIGGGTIRDIMLGIHPLAWIGDISYLLAIGAGVIIAVIARRQLLKLTATMLLFDAVGIGLYTILGTQKSLAADVNPLAAIILGMFSAVFGGVIRDTLLNDLPLIFRKEIYATACLAGGSLFVLLRHYAIDADIAAFAGIALVIAVRVIAVYKSWSLPKMGD